MKCRHCQSKIKESDPAKIRKSNCLCNKCYKFEKKWMKSGLKHSGVLRG